MTPGFDIQVDIVPDPDGAGFACYVTAWAPTRDAHDADPQAATVHAASGYGLTRAHTERVAATLYDQLRDRLVSRYGPPARRVAGRPAWEDKA